MTISSPHRPRSMVWIAGVRGVPHVGVADQADVGAQLGGVGLEEGRQVDAARFLLALEQDGDRDRQRAGHRLPGPAGLDEGHDLALVVRGAAARGSTLRAVRPGLDERLERVVVPQLERVDRLDVVVAVEQRRRARGRRGRGRPPSGGRASARTLASKPMLRRSAACHSARRLHSAA